MTGPCSECMHLDKGKVVYSSIMRDRKKYGCRKNRYIPFWVKDEKLLEDSLCECCERCIEKNATESVQNDEIDVQNVALVKCTGATEKRENEQNMKREDYPISKEGQLEGQIDIFHLEMWKV